MSDRDGLADWLLTTQGRLARIVAGSLVILIGLGVIGGFLGVLLLLVGAVPIASAAYGTLLIGPLLGRDIRGRRPEDQPREEKEEDGGDDQRDDGDEEAREDESAQASGGARRGDEPAEEPQEQLEKDASGEPTATRGGESDQGRRTKDPRSEPNP